MGKAGQRGKKEPDEKKEPEDIRARKLVEEVVPQHIEQWAAAIGLRRTDVPFEQFREGVTEALGPLGAYSQTAPYCTSA